MHGFLVAACFPEASAGEHGDDCELLTFCIPRGSRMLTFFSIFGLNFCFVVPIDVGFFPVRPLSYCPVVSASVWSVV